MPITSETGHNKNVANFSTAFQILEEMGALYNPANANLKLDKLAPIKKSLADVIEVLDQKKPLYKNAVAEREVEIAKLNKLITRSLNLAKSLEIPEQSKEHLSSLAKKIRGSQTAKPRNPENAEKATISTSQQSFDSRLANLNTYIGQLSSLTAYAPNEAELQTDTFKKFHFKVASLNSIVNTAGNELLTARKNRDQILYLDQYNAMQQIKDSKAYLRSLGDLAAPYYKALVKLQFRTILK